MLLKTLVGERGFEPPTPGPEPGGLASFLLCGEPGGFDHLRFYLQWPERRFENGLQAIENIGERGRNRTFNLLIKSQLLCQLSYAP
jgi:hypothetical protein